MAAGSTVKAPITPSPLNRAMPHEREKENEYRARATPMRTFWRTGLSAPPAAPWREAATAAADGRASPAFRAPSPETGSSTNSSSPVRAFIRRWESTKAVPDSAGNSTEAAAMALKPNAAVRRKSTEPIA